MLVSDRNQCFGFFVILSIILTINLEIGDALSCYVCKKSSEKNYAEAENFCNSEGPRRCQEEAAKGCMVEGFKMDFLFHVVKRCVMECPVFVNSSSELIRCCPVNGCNDFISRDSEFDFRPEIAPEKDIRFVSVRNDVNADKDEGVDKGGGVGDVNAGLTSSTPSQEFSTTIVIHPPPPPPSFTINSPPPADRPMTFTLGPPPPPPPPLDVTFRDFPTANQDRGSVRTTRRPPPGDGRMVHQHNHHRHHFRSQFDGGPVSCRGSRSGSARQSATLATRDLVAVVCFSVYVTKRWRQ